VSAHPRRENPFNYRTPVIDPTKLIDRRTERTWFARAAENLHDGTSKHGLLIGPRGGGKSSVLNVLAADAARTGLLPVRFPLNESVVASSEGFFEALLTAGMIELERSGDFRASDGRLVRWAQQVGRLETTSPPLLYSPEQPFIDAGSMIRDCEVIATLASEINRRGVALFMDDAHLIRDDSIITQTLVALLNGAQIGLSSRPRIRIGCRSSRKPIRPCSDGSSWSGSVHYERCGTQRT